MWAGVTSLQESVGRIVNPEEASYDAVKGAYDLAQGDSNIIEVHGFYVDEDAKYASFDLVISFDAPDRHAEAAVFPGLLRRHLFRWSRAALSRS